MLLSSPRQRSASGVPDAVGDERSGTNRSVIEAGGDDLAIVTDTEFTFYTLTHSPGRRS